MPSLLAKTLHDREQADPAGSKGGVLARGSGRILA